MNEKESSKLAYTNQLGFCSKSKGKTSLSEKDDFSSLHSYLRHPVCSRKY